MNAPERFGALLYPAPDSLLPEDWHARIAARLEAPEGRAEFAALLARRIERQRRAGFLWERGAAGERYTSEGEEPLVRLSSRLAEAMEARTVRSMSLPLVVWLAFMLGLLLGAAALALLNKGSLAALLG
jgi:hypothetical protein